MLSVVSDKPVITHNLLTSLVRGGFQIIPLVGSLVEEMIFETPNGAVAERMAIEWRDAFNSLVDALDDLRPSAANILEKLKDHTQLNKDLLAVISELHQDLTSGTVRSPRILEAIKRLGRSNFRQVGIQENVDFVGREKELEKIAKQLKRGDVAITHATESKCRVGKTQLAVAYAFKHWDEYDGIWWLAADETRLKVSTGKLARMLNPALPRNIPYAECRRFICECLSDGRRHLLILDNLERACRLDDWRLTAPSRLLVTTRLASVPVRRFHNLQLTDLGRFDAIALLRKHRYNLSDDGPLDALAEHLGDHALALALAGSYLTKFPDVSPKKVLDKLWTWDETVMDDLDPEIPECTRHVAETLMLHVPNDLGLSLRGKILSIAAFCHPDAIPVSLFAAVLRQTAVEIRKELAVLKRLSVLQYSEDCVSLHRLTQAVLRARLTPKQREEQIEAIRLAAAERFRDDIGAEAAGWPETHRWLPHVLALLDRVPDEAQKVDWAFVANQVGVILKTHALRQEALRYLYKAEHIDRAALGDGHPDVARDVNNIGLILREQGKLEQALARFRDAERIYRAASGDMHSDVAMTLNNIGLVLRDQTKLAKALDNFKKAERINRNVFGRDHPEVATIVNNIGLVFQQQGKFHEALVYFAEAGLIDRRTFGNDHPNVARDVNNSGITLWKHADSLRQADGPYTLKEFFDHIRDAEELCRAVFGDVLTDVAEILNDIALVLRDQGTNNDVLGSSSADRLYKLELEQALVHLRNAESIYRAVFGDMHSDVAMALNNIGLVLRGQGKYNHAIRSYRGAEDIWRQILGHEHPNVATCVNNIGFLMETVRDMAGARKCYREALKIYRWNRLPRTHENVRIVKKNRRRVGMWRMLWKVWWKMASILDKE